MNAKADVKTDVKKLFAVEIPSATPDEKRSGWTIKYSVLEEISIATTFQASMEQVEIVILELAKRGHVIVSPNQ